MHPSVIEEFESDVQPPVKKENVKQLKNPTG
jgi:hypothetical protein